MNLGLRALLRGADRPAVDGHSRAHALNPGLAKRALIDGEELRIGEPKREPSPPSRQAVADDEAAADSRQVGLQQPRKSADRSS